MELKPRTLSQILEMVKPLYEKGDLLGFSVCDDDGKSIHNESFLCDERAYQATFPFIAAFNQLKRATRLVERITVELDDVILIYRKIEEGHALFSLRRNCDLDTAAEALN